MKYALSVLLLTSTVSAHAEPTNVNATVTYNIALQNEFGVDRQAVAAPIGGETRELKIAGGVVQIRPPNTADGQSVIKFFAGNDAKPVLMHTASITSSSVKPVEIAYTLCGPSLRFQSPAPEKLEQCPSAASVSER